MNLKPEELEFLCAWAKEEKAPDPYSLPAHQAQAAHQVKGVTFIRAIKAWAQGEGRRDEDIFQLFAKPGASWPWSSEEDIHARLVEPLRKLSRSASLQTYELVEITDPAEQAALGERIRLALKAEAEADKG